MTDVSSTLGLVVPTRRESYVPNYNLLVDLSAINNVVDKIMSYIILNNVLIRFIEHE